MRLGNVTGDIYDRSIHKKLNHRREEIASGAAYGEDCAIFSIASGKKAGSSAAAFDLSEGLRVAAAQSQSVYTGENSGKFAVYAAVNRAAASGAGAALGVLVSILLPAEAEEQALRCVVAEAQEAAQTLNTAIADVKASVMSAVNEICVTATAVGIGDSGLCAADVAGEGAFWHEKMRVDGAGPEGKRREKAAAWVVMTKWAGLEGSAILASRFKEKLRSRYPSYLIEEAAAFDRFLSIVPEAAAAGKSGSSVLCAAAEGGIFRALWTLAECAGVGLEIDLKKIPIRQETVEICNFLDINPYELMANGSLLCLTEQPEALLKELQREQIPAAVIGSVIPSRDRVVVNGEERRFLEPAKADEIYRILK